MHSHMGLLWNGHHPQGPGQWLCWCCTSLEQCLCVCDPSPMVFGPDWEVKLQEKSWLLCCAEILGQHRQQLHSLACGTWGSWAVYFGKQGGKWAPKSSNVVQYTTWSQESTVQRKTSLRCGERLGDLSPSKAGKVVSAEGTQENWWLLGLHFDTTGIQSVLGAEPAAGDGGLDLFPLWSFPVRTSGGCFLSFFHYNLYIPLMCRWLMDTGKGGPYWVGDVTHTSPIFQCKQWSCWL